MLGVVPAGADAPYTAPELCGPDPVVPGPECYTEADWTNAVAEMAPRLEPCSLQEAMKILDRAVGNIRRARALEIAMSPPFGVECASAASAAECVRTEIRGEQLSLLRQFHGLCADAAAGLLTPHSEAELGQDAGRAAQASPEARSTAQRKQTLSTSLQLLEGVDPDCVLILRRINKLGFKAGQKLKRHFAKYGNVVQVLVAHSTVRQMSDMPADPRRRPSSMGFMHLGSPRAVQAILAMGEEQQVEGAVIRVHRFERRADCPDEACDEELAFDADFTKCVGFGRQQSSYSTVSTHTGASLSPSAAEEDGEVSAKWGRQQSGASVAFFPAAAAEEAALDDASTKFGRQQSGFSAASFSPSEVETGEAEVLTF